MACHTPVIPSASRTLAACLLVLLPLAAQGQVISPKTGDKDQRYLDARKGLFENPVKKPSEHIVRQVSRAETVGMRDIGRAAPQPALDPVYALRGFNLRFQNGDHKLRRIGVLGDGRFVNFALADSNGDDPFTANAEFINLSQGRMGEVAAMGSGKFDIPLPPIPEGHVPVLAGFEFRRADGTDANVRNIGVWLDPTNAVARVSLIDDNGLDLRGLEATLGAFIAGIALPGVSDWAAPIAMGSSPVIGQFLGDRVLKATYGKQRGYQVRVLYALIPRLTIAREGALAGTDRTADNPSGLDRAPRVDLLQGFEFTFMNSDHHLLGLAVNGRRRNEDEKAHPGVLFRDNNRDDPVQWQYTYVTLRDTPAP